MRNAVLVDWRATADNPPLRAVLTKAEPVPGAADLDAQVAALQVAGPRLTGPEQGQGAVRWRMVSEPRSKVSMPFLTGAPVAGAMRRINASLEQRFQGQISEALSIGSRVRGEAEFYNTVFVTGARYFVIGESVYSYLGGAHGNFNFSVTTLICKAGSRSNWPSATISVLSSAQAGRQPDSVSWSKRERSTRRLPSPTRNPPIGRTGSRAGGTGRMPMRPIPRPTAMSTLAACPTLRKACRTIQCNGRCSPPGTVWQSPTTVLRNSCATVVPTTASSPGTRPRVRAGCPSSPAFKRIARHRRRPTRPAQAAHVRRTMNRAAYPPPSSIHGAITAFT